MSGKCVLKDEEYIVTLETSQTLTWVNILEPFKVVSSVLSWCPQELCLFLSAWNPGFCLLSDDGWGTRDLGPGRRARPSHRHLLRDRSLLPGSLWEQRALPRPSSAPALFSWSCWFVRLTHELAQLCQGQFQISTAFGELDRNGTMYLKGTLE